MQDLTRPIRSGMQTYPGDPEARLEPVATVAEDGYGVHRLQCSSHAGTHVDAPAHVLADGETIDDRPVEEFVLDARVVDPGPLEAREAISPNQLPDPIDADLLVIDTGWAEHWGTDRYLDHPYLAPAAAEALADADCGVGLDTFGPDPTPTDLATPDEPEGTPAHRALLGAGLPIVENLRNLGGLPERVRLYAFPLPLGDGDGAPARVVAEPLDGG